MRCAVRFFFVVAAVVLGGQERGIEVAVGTWRVDSARFWCVGVRDFGSGGIGCCQGRGVVLVGIESA